MKTVIVICVCLGLLFWTWVALRLTHTLDYYTIHSAGNIPTLPPGKIVFASRLKTPDYNDFICFKLPGKYYTGIYRCIGKPGDSIELRAAKVYRNGKLLTELFTNNDYYIYPSQLKRIKQYIKQNKIPIDTIRDTLYRVALSYKELKRYHLKLTPDVVKKGAVTEDLFEKFKNAGYNEDNIGPLKVPASSYFVLGDNRHMAFDSRYVGFIKEEEVVATVLNH